jgi:hypothetical protein
MNNQTNADDRQSKAISDPDSRIDHEAGRRPTYVTGALSDPEQADKHGNRADEKQRDFHGVPDFSAVTLA